MKALRIIAAIAATVSLHAVSAAQENSLKFNENGVFRIAQFTDMHLDASTAYRQAQAEKTFGRLSRIVRTEKPDLLAFTGDVVTGSPASLMWNRLMDSLSVYGIPFCVVLGNHDAEQDISRGQIADIVTSSGYSINGKDKSGELADMEFTVMHSREDSPAAALYFMDSHDNSPMENIDGYAWFTPAQVEWLRNSCTSMTEKNGGRPLPALAFFHIALQEYDPAWHNPQNTKTGRSGEDSCPGALNTGMYAAMVETGSVMGTFVGHDHDIDYIVAQYGIALGYGRFSGDDTTYNNLRPGVRIIDMEEGQRAFRSWIIEDDGRVVDMMRFDGCSVKGL